jgi:nucleolar pre-ribosomal-associated protein 1
MLLKLIALSPEGELYSGIKTLLIAILRDHDMLQMSTYPDGLDALIASLGVPSGASAPSPQVLDFLDDCCARFMKGPIKYFDDKETMSAKGPQSEVPLGPLSPLLLTLVEQWPFKGGKDEKGNPAESLAQWLSKLLYLLKLIGEDDSLLELVRDALTTSAAPAYQEVLKDAFLWKMGKEKAKAALKLATGADFSGSERSSASPIPTEQRKAPVGPTTAINLELPPKEDEKHAGLNRWRKKDLEESIENGDIGELLLCLCSQHAEIRLQAVLNIRQLIGKIDVCTTLFPHILHANHS